MSSYTNVLFLVMDDFANVSKGFVDSLKEVGVLASGLKFVAHLFHYKEELRVKEHDLEILGAVNGATHIVYCQSTRMTRDCIPRDRKNKKLYLFVGDQLYRRDPQRVLSYYPPLTKVFYQGSDLKGKSPYPEAWLLPAIDTDFIKTKDDSLSYPIRIAHYPRDPRDKGSEVINRVMSKFQQDPEYKDKFVYDYSEGWITDWEKNLERLDSCDIYIESQAYTIKSGNEERPCCEFGMTALEACALSKMVITCFNSHLDYVSEFGDESAIMPSNSEEDLEYWLKTLLELPKEKLIAGKQATREWVCENHSLRKTGERLIKLLDI